MAQTELVTSMKANVSYSTQVMSSPGVSAQQNSFQSYELLKLQSVHSCVNAEKFGDVGASATLKVQNLVFQPVLKVCRINKAYTIDDMSDAGSF